MIKIYNNNNNNKMQISINPTTVPPILKYHKMNIFYILFNTVG